MGGSANRPGPPAQPPGTVPALVREAPPLLWAITGLHVLVLVAYTALVPTYRAPDEPLHVDLVLLVRDQLAGREPLGWPAVGDRHPADRINASLRYLRFSAGPHRQRIEDAEPRGSRPSFDELGGAHERTVLDHNQQVQHPPTYYALAAVWLALPPGSRDWPFDRQVTYLRLLSVVLLAPLPLLLYAAGLLLSRRRSVALGAALTALAVPQLTYIGAVVNNDSLLLLAAAAMTVPLLRAARGDHSLGTAAWGGAAFGLALAAKGLALALAPWVAAAYLLGWRRSRRPVPWRSAGLLVALTVFVGGWWWLRRLLATGAVHVRGTVYPTDPAFTPDPLEWLGEAFLPRLLETWWGTFVWAGAVMPYPLVLLPAAVALAAAVGALALRGLPPGSRLDTAVLLLPSALLLGLTAWASYTTYARTGLAVGIQGRYLFSGFVGVGAGVAFGCAKALRGGERFLPLGLLAAAAALHGGAVAHLLTHHWDRDFVGFLPSIRAAVAWFPWSPWVVLPLGVLAVVLAIGVAAGCLRFAGGGSLGSSDRGC